MSNLYSPFKTLYFISILIFYIHMSQELDFCEKHDEYIENNDNCENQYKHLSKKRYIFYDVNPPEGFNLRRDVYVRVAVFLKNLIANDNEYKWHLVLPPWGNLYHWQSKNIGPQIQLPWDLFFDIASLQKYIPVMEMYMFLEEYFLDHGKTQLDIVYVLQNDENMFKTGQFENRNIITDCPLKSVRYHKIEKEKYNGYFWGYSNITARQIKCVVFHGSTSDLKVNLEPMVHRTVMFDHMEIALHDTYGSQEYWRARRSMRYASELYDIANKYREKYFNSTDKNDFTERPTDWTKEKSKRNAVGGPYLAIHLRRRDFIIGRAKTTPTIESAAHQLKKKMDERGLKHLFVATDATKEEFLELKSYLSNYTVLNFTPSNYIRNKFKDGGVAIIDQIICSYARYFVGTYESTYTFRIQEDREIIGFPSETTFNVLCKTKDKCSLGGQWEIVW